MEAHRKSAFDIIMTTIITLICVTVAFFIIQDLVASKEKGRETMMTDSGASGTVNVSVESASIGSVVSYTKLYGDIVTDTDPVTLYSDVSGKITSILVARGDRVEKGDVIAYVDQSRPGYSYQESPVTSTVSGQVLSLSASVGDTVTTSTSLVEVRTDEDLKLATEVPERYISALESGSTSSFTVAAFPDRTYEAVLSYVSPTVDTSTRTADIELDIKESDLRFDTFRSSGPGGQSVNTTSSAVRVTHIPTGISAQCQNEKSQHHNKDSALRILKARLYNLELQKREAERQAQYAGKDAIAFGSQIRTYTLQPYRLVKDHRTNSEAGDVEAVLNGQIDQFQHDYLLYRHEQQR